MVPPAGMGSAPSCLHSGCGFICHRSIHRVYYNSRKPEAGTESQAPGCMIPHSSPVSLYPTDSMVVIISDGIVLVSFPRYLNAYLTNVSYVPVVPATEWMGTHILTVKRPLGNPSCTLSCNRLKPASRKTFFQCKSDLERRS
jgi:hypothetical protein